MCDSHSFRFCSPEPASLVSGVEEINLKHEESIVSLLLPPGLVGGLRGRNPLLVVSSVTPGGFLPIRVCVFVCSSFGIMHHCTSSGIFKLTKRKHIA